MKNKYFYVGSVMVCFICAVVAKVIRPVGSDDDTLINLLLGSAPSFFYIIGIISLAVLITPKRMRKSANKTILFITLGASMYEIEQYWSSRVFDIFDLIATCLGAFFIWAIYRYHFPKEDSFN